MAVSDAALQDTQVFQFLSNKTQHEAVDIVQTHARGAEAQAGLLDIQDSLIQFCLGFGEPEVKEYLTTKFLFPREKRFCPQNLFWGQIQFKDGVRENEKAKQLSHCMKGHTSKFTTSRAMYTSTETPVFLHTTSQPQLNIQKPSLHFKHAVIAENSNYHTYSCSN